uniref:Putative conserved secreted protein n=1 Tax=Ixodes scapularis TaxID=6945 RepID=A0A4D5S7B6_IXOSC
MHRVTGVIICAAFIAVATCLSASSENADLIDVLVHKDTKKLGEEAIQVGQILRECAKNLKNESTEEAFPGDEAEEYFFRKMWKKMKESAKLSAKRAVPVIKAKAREFLARKAEELIRGLIKKHLGSYALEDTESYHQFLFAISEDIDQMGQDLIQRGGELLKWCEEINFLRI